jgi:hypothetical protein
MDDQFDVASLFKVVRDLTRGGDREIMVHHAMRCSHFS